MLFYVNRTEHEVMSMSCVCATITKREIVWMYSGVQQQKTTREGDTRETWEVAVVVSLSDSEEVTGENYLTTLHHIANCCLLQCEIIIRV